MHTAVPKHKIQTVQHPFNWPVVGLLLFLTGIPAIPAVFLLILVAMGPSAIEGASSIIHHTHFDTPAAIYVHGLAGIVFFLTMPFQFSPKIRIRNLAWHKMSGRIALLSGYTLALSAPWIHLVMTPQALGPRFYCSGADERRYVYNVFTCTLACPCTDVCLHTESG